MAAKVNQLEATLNEALPAQRSQTPIEKCETLKPKDVTAPKLETPIAEMFETVAVQKREQTKSVPQEKATVELKAKAPVAHNREAPIFPKKTAETAPLPAPLAFLDAKQKALYGPDDGCGASVCSESVCVTSDDDDYLSRARYVKEL